MLNPQRQQRDDAGTAKLKPRSAFWRGALTKAIAASTMIAAASFSMTAHAADLTAREVTAALFKTSADKPLDFAGKDLSALDLSGLDFKAADLTGVNFYGADLSGARLVKTKLAGSRLDRATITGTNFSGADLSRATILRPNVFSTMEIDVRELPSFEGAKMTGANITGRLDRISFKGADLTEAFFGPRNPDGETLITPRIEMSGCDFTDANLHKADLSLNNVQYAKFVNADLTGANFSGANLSRADFSGADITDADFTGAAIDGALFKGTKGLDRAKGFMPPVGDVGR